MAPLRPPPLPPHRAPTVDVVHEMATPPHLPAIPRGEPVIKRMADSAKILWAAGGIIVAMVGGAFGAGMQFADMKTEFRLQMQSMVTKTEFDGRIDSAIERAVIKVKERVPADLADDVYDRCMAKVVSSEFRTLCPAFVSRGAMTAVCKVRSVKSLQ